MSTTNLAKPDLGALAQALKQRNLPTTVANEMELSCISIADAKALRLISGELRNASHVIRIPTRDLDGAFTEQGRLRLVNINGAETPQKLDKTTGEWINYRYHTPFGQSPPPYLTTDVSAHSARKDPNISLFITEGEFKAAAVASTLRQLGNTGWVVIGLRGVSMHGVTNGQMADPDVAVSHIQGLHHTLRQFHLATWHSGGLDLSKARRKVFICMDWDPVTGNNDIRVHATDPKDPVKLEEEKLAAKYHILGADVRVIRLAKLAETLSDKKLAIDDLIQAQGPCVLEMALNSATQWECSAEGHSFHDQRVAIAAMQTRVCPR